MEIKREELVKLNACSDGLAWYDAQPSHDLAVLIKAAISEGREAMDYANWGIVRLMTRGQKVEYAVYAAKQVLRIYETKYPGDDRPRKAIEAAEKYFSGPSSSAAYAYADAAYAYADAADAAAYAADAAYAAAYAADAAYAAYAADAAARAARAVGNRLLAKILRRGVLILTRKGE